MAIQGFFEDFAFLSNYYPSQVGMDGIRGASVEHVFQAMKALDHTERSFIAAQTTSDEAKKCGRRVTLREDWKRVRIPIMETLVREKFLRHEGLRRLLLNTGEDYLEETNHWGDTFWGVYRGEGENHLGKILMRVRKEFREAGPSADENRSLLSSLLDTSIITARRGSLFENAPFPIALDVDFDKVEGMMLGLAVGDSLGNSSEGAPPAIRAQRYGEVRDYLPTRHAEGRAVGLPSDDTQLAFWTIEQMLKDGRFVPNNTAQFFASGRRIFGLGGTVRLFLDNLKKSGKPWYACGPNSAGNGALMRIAPMLIPHLRRPSSALWADTALSAMMTHNDAGSIAACSAFVNMLWKLLSMDSAPDPMWWLINYVNTAKEIEGETVYTPRGGAHRGWRGPIWKFVEEKVAQAYEHGLSTRQACDSWYSGAFLLETVPSVLYILMRHAQSFEEAAVRAVSDTKDNDTIAAIVGAAVGALHGKAGIPERWLTNLVGRTSFDDDGQIFRLLQEGREMWWDRAAESDPEIA